jgi:4-hydroxy-3-methylbut-2-enyl diphosphate reductase
MEVIVAKTAGFCFGVNRAVQTVYEQIDKKKDDIYTFGPIIHNEIVVADLEKKGVHVLESEEELNELTKGTVVIRSHGVSEHIYELAKSRGLEVVDATCPFVKKIHRLVRQAGEEKRHVIIIGQETHPEVEGIKGWCIHGVSIVQSEEELRNLSISPKTPVTIVAQTTFNLKKFEYLVEISQKIWYNVNIVNTICNATQERQTEAKLLASSVDAMIVIGGKNSSNTQKLYEICRHECNNTYYIQTLEDLTARDFLTTVCTVGITAGASTPKNIIEEVQSDVRTNF